MLFRFLFYLFGGFGGVLKRVIACGCLVRCMLCCVWVLFDLPLRVVVALIVGSVSSFGRVYLRVRLDGSLF